MEAVVKNEEVTPDKIEEVKKSPVNLMKAEHFL